MEQLGNGTYCEVFAIDKNHVLKKYRYGMDYAKNAIRELACMTFLRHYSIPAAYSNNIIIFNNKDIYVKMKRLDEVVLRPEFLRRFLVHISSALSYCHNFGIIHKDIKTDNIMYDFAEDWYILIDWGLASILTTEHNFNTEITSQYKPPEWLGEENCKNYGGKCDIWALGITVLMLLFPLANLHELKEEKVILQYFEDRIGRDRNVRIKKLKDRTEDFFESDIFEILVDMLDFDPDTRISAKDITVRLGCDPEKHIYVDTCIDIFLRTDKTTAMFKRMKKWIEKATRELEIIEMCKFTSLTLADKLSTKFTIIDKYFEVACCACINISAHLYYDCSTIALLVNYCDNFDCDRLIECRNIFLNSIGFNILP
uniref:Putative serine/threonine protein kinase n=1 Tax=Pithovirus LCPAC403 TaxID=2506596 RepID=A0A481ZB11_9VIRU|nr:MAG: putative serine/threonine protein kinase [Pithovirus LCPAC403]